MLTGEYRHVLDLRRRRVNEMNAREFFDKVCDMRMAQKTYFKTRDPHDLRVARKIEGDIDREIDRVRGLLHQQTVVK